METLGTQKPTEPPQSMNSRNPSNTLKHQTLRRQTDPEPTQRDPEPGINKKSLSGLVPLALIPNSGKPRSLKMKCQILSPPPRSASDKPASRVPRLSWPDVASSDRGFGLSSSFTGHGLGLRVEGLGVTRILFVSSFHQNPSRHSCFPRLPFLGPI